MSCLSLLVFSMLIIFMVRFNEWVGRSRRVKYPYLLFWAIAMGHGEILVVVKVCQAGERLCTESPRQGHSCRFCLHGSFSIVLALSSILMLTSAPDSSSQLHLLYLKGIVSIKLAGSKKGRRLLTKVSILQTAL